MARKKVALILGGGGARGAYQVGVLKAWQEIFRKGGQLEILVGVSAGSINASRLMQDAPDYAKAIDSLKELWGGLFTAEIFESGFQAVASNLMRLLRSSRHGDAENDTSIVNAMLNTTPLHAYLNRNLDMEQVHQRLRTLPAHALAFTCFDYSDRRNMTFFETLGNLSEWIGPNAGGKRFSLTVEHIMASCAAPLLFPPVLMDGHYYGDGSLRNITPLQSAIRLGADRIINISLSGEAFKRERHETPTLGRIASTLFDGMFLDSLELDSHVLERINTLTERLPEKDRDTKMIDLCRVAPMFDFSLIAQRHRNRFPRTLRYLFGGWITPDMLSYLLFDGEYARELIEYGRKDGESYKDMVEEWLRN